MFKNYFRIAYRNLRRNRSYTLINIGGLAVGIAVCMVIFFIIRFHTSFDNFHANKDRIYRVLTEYHHADNGNIEYGKEVPLPLPAAMKAAFPGLEQIATIWASQNDQVLIPDESGKPVKMFKEPRGVFFTESSFFKVFNFPLLAGSYASLKDPNNVLLTREVATRYFGDWKLAMGRTINLEVGGHMFEHGTDKLKVTGILETIPPNTDLQLKMVVAFGTGITGFLSESTDWQDNTNSDFGCYLLLAENTAPGNFNQQLRSFIKQIKGSDKKNSHIIQPISAVHYDVDTSNFSNKAISRDLLNVLWLIAGFILLIACVNFINLATAQSVGRAKEIAVRKVLGSNRCQLQVQFLLETFLIVVGAVLLAIAITLAALPSLNRILAISLVFDIFRDSSIIVFLVSVTLIVTALAGFYPSIIVSNFNPVQALKTKPKVNSSTGLSLRRALVVFQFIIAQALIIGTLIIVSQMNYFMNQPLGFDKNAIINVPFRLDSLRISRLDFLRQQLLTVNGVKAVSFCSNTPVEESNDLWTSFRFGNADKDQDFKVILKWVDEDYAGAYNLPLIAGRNLRPSAMTREFLVNETFMKSLGIASPENILNKEISMWNGMIRCPVVGVLKDFNDRSFRHQVAPLLLTTNTTMYNQATIKFTNKNTATTLRSVKTIFDKTFPNFVYEYRFLDEKIAGFYKQEEQLAQLYKIFATIAIILSCLGLYGLSSFMAVQRTREVGIRKVLGASAGSIIFLFSKEFLLLIGAAFAIATPLAWYYMHQWLENYVYRISISWWSFVAGGFAAIAIALVTIGFQAIKAAASNPVNSLRAQ